MTEYSCKTDAVIQVHEKFSETLQTMKVATNVPKSSIESNAGDYMKKIKMKVQLLEVS